MPWSTDRDKRKQDARNYGPAWRRKRLECLRAAKWRCEIRLEGCQGAASEVDHVDQVGNDPRHENLRAACHACHKTVTAGQGGGYRNKPPDDPAPRPRTAW